MTEPDNLVLAHLREFRSDMNGRFDALNARFDDLEARVDQRFSALVKRLEQLEGPRP